MLVLIKGAGDLATGIACRLYQSGFRIILTDLEKPTTVRCTVAFSRAAYEREAVVEGIVCRRAASPAEALALTEQGCCALLADPDCRCLSALQPDALVDAILAKENTGTHIGDAPAVIGVGPGFTAGVDCHAAVETQRGHDLGRVLYEGSPVPNTGIPGEVGGYSIERLIRSPADGIFQPCAAIGDTVQRGQTVAAVDGIPVTVQIDGVLRGLLPAGTCVFRGMKSGDVDPRGCRSHCFSISDKARAVGGGVLEAILHTRSGEVTL